MKSTLFVGAVLAASQCMPEPSDPAGSTAASVSTDAGTTADAGESPAPDASAAANPETAKRLLVPGPAPFTVPTARVVWPQQKATLLAPQGTRIDGDGSQATVILGEGHNFAFGIAPAGAVPQLVPSADEAGVSHVSRDDGAQMWFVDGHWFFSGTFGAFDCWNAPDAEHDRAEVEMMLASCKSLEQDTPK